MNNHDVAVVLMVTVVEIHLRYHGVVDRLVAGGGGAAHARLHEPGNREVDEEGAMERMAVGVRRWGPAKPMHRSGAW